MCGYQLLRSYRIGSVDLLAISADVCKMAAASGFEDTLNLQQEEALETLRNEVKGTKYEERIRTHPDSTRFLLRVLRATMKDKSKKRIFQVKEAKARLFAILDWKEEYDVDINKKPPEFDEYRKVYPALFYADYRAETIVWIRKFHVPVYEKDVKLMCKRYRAPRGICDFREEGSFYAVCVEPLHRIYGMYTFDSEEAAGLTGPYIAGGG